MVVISKVVAWEDVWDLKTLHRGIITHTGMMEEKDHDSHRFGIYGEVKKKLIHTTILLGNISLL